MENEEIRVTDDGIEIFEKGWGWLDFRGGDVDLGCDGGDVGEVAQ